jgi:tetratricopeptide (TPR) repeat protein
MRDHLAWRRSEMVFGALMCCVFAAGDPVPSMADTSKPVLGLKPYDPNLYKVPGPRLTHEEQCRRAQQKCAEKVARLQEQMREPNSPEELGQLKHELAKTYELMTGRGEDARQTYADILKTSGDYSRCYEVALRLGQLYSCVTLPGTKADPNRAVAYYEEAIDRCPPGRLVKQQAHLSLGTILWHKGDKAGAQKHLEEAYRFDPALLTLHDDNLPESEKRDRLRLFRSDGEKIRDDALGLFVAAYRDRSDPAKTLTALDELERRYAGDPRVLEIIQKERDMTLKRGQKLLPQLNSVMSFPGGTKPNEAPSAK